MQQEIEHVTEFAETTADNTKLRDYLTKPRKEWNECKITIKKLYCTIQQLLQQKEIDALTLRTETFEHIGDDNITAKKFLNTARSEMN